MTIDWLEVDCARIFSEGQAYVALSRGKGIRQMAVRNLDMTKVTASRAVSKFYEAIAHGQTQPASTYRKEYWENWYSKMLLDQSFSIKFENEIDARKRELEGKLCEQCGLQLEPRLQRAENNQRKGQWMALCPDSRPSNFHPFGGYYPWS